MTVDNRPRQLTKLGASPVSYDPEDKLLETTIATVDRLWSITEDLNILYKDNWTHLAQLEMRHYQHQIIKSLRKSLLDERYSFRQSWTFPMAFLYALTLITTIGTNIRAVVLSLSLISSSSSFQIIHRFRILHSFFGCGTIRNGGLRDRWHTVVSDLFVNSGRTCRPCHSGHDVLPMPLLHSTAPPLSQ